MTTKSDSVEAASPFATAFKPLMVSIDDACILLGRKKTARSSIKLMLARGELDAVKDGERTLITMASIERRAASLPTAKFKPPHKLQGRTHKQA